MKTLGPKHPLEIKIIRFVFSGDIAGATMLSSVAPVTSSVIDGTDAAPQNIVLGLATISGSEVLQRITGGLDGVTYLLECVATDSAGNVHVAQAVVPVRRKLY